MDTNQAVRILFVEDIPADMELAVRVLRKEGLRFTSKRVETEDEFSAALDEFQPDVIVSDYALPEFDGIHALQIALARDPTLPFIVLTGALNDETAVACIKAGATDYVIKERIARLPFAIKEALAQHEALRQKEAAEQALRESEQRFATIFHASPIGICLTVFADGRIEDANNAFLNMIGYAREHVVGRTTLDLNLWVNPEERKLIVDLLCDRNRIQNFEITFRKESGDLGYFLTSMEVIEISGQQYILNMFSDITARKQAEAEILRLNEFNESIIQNMQEGIVISDAENCSMFINPAAALLLGYPPEELQGRPWTTILPPEYHARIAAINDRRQRGEIDRYEIEIVRKDGGRRTVLVSSSPRFEQEHFVGTLAVFTDITERKQAEYALQHLNVELEQRVQKRTEELRATNDQLQAEIVERRRAEAAADAANQAKSDFLANMSHELRTPLNAILGYAQILQDAANLTEQQSAEIRTIHTSGQHLLHMINDILDLAKIEAGRMELTLSDVRLPDLLRDLEEMIHIRTHQQGIVFVTEFAADLPAGIRADAKYLQAVLINLLSNAVKFAKRGCVTLRVGCHRLSNPPLQTAEAVMTNIRFEVEDTGIGIASDELDKIFLPFHQVGKLSQSIEGTGLGLAISRKIVDLMGGTLQVMSTLGQGSTFWFEIPVSLAVTLPTSAPVNTAQIVGYTGPRRLLLVVDDYAVNRKLLLSMLPPLGFNVLEAENGPICLAKAQEHTPDLILMDLRMPDMDGFEVVQRLRALERLRETVIIACSASVFADTRQHSLAVGCNDFLAKPVQRPELLAILQKYLQVEWIYAPTTDMSPEVSRPPADLAALITELPPDTYARLHKYANRGDVKSLLAELQMVEQLGAQFMPLVQELRALARGFQVDTLAELFDSSG